MDVLHVGFHPKDQNSIPDRYWPNGTKEALCLVNGGPMDLSDICGTCIKWITNMQCKSSLRLALMGHENFFLKTLIYSCL